MTRLFDGLGRLTAGVMGGAVTVTPHGGAARQVQAVFRIEPTPVVQNGNDVIVEMTTLRGPRDVIGDLVRNSRVGPVDGILYRVIGDMGTRNPAPDGHMVLQLERV